MGFLVVNNLATNLILAAAYINGIIEKTSPKKGTLRPTGSSPGKIVESAGNAACVANNVKTKQGQYGNEHSEYP